MGRRRFKGRVLPIDLKTTIQWGSLQGKSEQAAKPMPAIDGFIAISGLVNNCIVVTRKTSDMERSTVE